MPRVRLVHWHAAEAAERAVRLRAAGFAADYHQLAGPAGLRELRQNPADAIVIDLGRLPMQGRDVGVAVRLSAATRRVPLVFVDGVPEKVARVTQQLPDATYTTWDRIGVDLRRALARPPAAPITPKSVFDPYAGVPLATKLGVKANALVALVGAPRGFEKTLGALPAGARTTPRVTRDADLTLWFVTSRTVLEDRVRQMVPLSRGGGLWIIWPKKAGGVVTDVSQVIVRRAGLAAGMVDYKITSLDASWSGLRFTRRDAPARQKRP